MLGELVVPVLRREFAINRPAHVPDGPLHPRLKAAAASGLTPEPTSAPAIASVPA